MKSLLKLRWSELRPLFEAALEQAPEARAAWLSQATSDPELRRAVLALIAQDQDLEQALQSTERHPLAAGSACPERLGPYRVLGELGRGGMGVVYLAEQQAPRRKVALKRLHHLADGTLRARFRREAEILAQLSHPGIARVIEVSQDGAGQPLLVLEYVEGRALQTVVPKLDRQQRIELLIAIADAVEHAHAKGIVHRDLKPQNVLVGADGKPKVLDFGVARLLAAADHSLTEAGMLLGTPAYMAPEQAAGSLAVDARADVWSLGVIAFEWLTDRLPLPVHGLTPLEALQVVAVETPPPLARLDRSLAGDLEVIVATALARDPSQRYPSAGALADDLRRYLAREPIRARRPGPWRRATLWLRRHPAIAASAAIALTALLLGSAVALHYARVASRERSEARLEAARQELLREHFAAVVNRAVAQGPSIEREALLDLAADPNLVAAPAHLRRAKLLAIADGLVVRADARRLAELLSRHAEWMADAAASEWAVFHKHRAWVALRLGDWEAAGRALQEAEAALRAAGWEQRIIAADVAGYRAQLARARGALDQALEHSGRAAAIARAASGASALERGVAIANHAVNLVQAGYPKAAATAVAEAEGIWRAGGVADNVNAASARSVLANALLAAGDPQAALAVFEATEAQYGATDSIPARAARRLAMARARAWLGAGLAASTEAEQAVQAMCSAQGEDSDDCRRMRAAAFDVYLIAGDEARVQAALAASSEAAPVAVRAARLVHELDDRPQQASLALVELYQGLPAADRVGRRQVLRLILLGASRLRAAGADALAAALLTTVGPDLSSLAEDGFEAPWWRIQHAALMGQDPAAEDLARMRGQGLAHWH